MPSAADYALHPQPVWRERADFIINAAIAGPDDGVQVEQLWVGRTDTAAYELCCIPFFLYDLALGDLVAVEVSADGQHQLAGVLKSSGRYVFRAWFGDVDNSVRQAVVDDVSQMPVLMEWYSANLLAMDVADVDHAQVLADYLMVAEGAGRVVYETGRLS